LEQVTQEDATVVVDLAQMVVDRDDCVDLPAETLPGKMRVVAAEEDWYAGRVPLAVNNGTSRSRSGTAVADDDRSQKMSA
jgi:hypothetical protein